MVKNGKYFVAPQKSSDNFKVLFARLAAEGAGRPVDQQGVPDGPWTPETLAEAISNIEANEKGIELRAVQTWFQDNNAGISNDNIRWLARIFGCGDPLATSHWQAELMAAKERLARERRQIRQEAAEYSKNPPRGDDSIPVTGGVLEAQSGSLEATLAIDRGTKLSGVNLALRAEAMFAGPYSLNLPIAIWGGLGVLWFLAFILGVHSVTYSPSDGINKQVGLIWSPGWNVGEPLFLPIFLIIVSGLLNSWTRSERANLLNAGEVNTVGSWRSKINSYRISFWAVFLICFIVIFLVQWAGVYLVPLLRNSPDVVMIDWMLIALVRPEVISTNAAIFVSFLGFLYSGMIYWFLFTGLLLLYTMSGDFAEICACRQAKDLGKFSHQAFTNGMKIMQGVFRCTILGILVALSIKVNAAYLVSDAESISGWLMHDALIALGLRSDGWTWINGSPSPFFTSFLLLFLLCFVFGACMLLVRSALERTLQSARAKHYAQSVWFGMSLVLVILAAGYILVGQFFGFSIILGISVAISLASLLWRPKPLDNKTHGI